MKIAKAPAHIEKEKKENLDRINIKSLSTTKNIFTAFFTIAAIAYFIIGLTIVEITNQLSYGLTLMIVGPITQMFLTLLINLFISIAYDTKIIKYTLIYAKENTNDDELKVPEEYEPELQSYSEPTYPPSNNL